MHPQFTASDIERFMSNVAIDPQSGCWLWTGDVQRRYGRFWWRGASHRAHRVAFEVAYGSIPDEMLVCHTCDNPLCVRNDDEGFYELDGVQHIRRGHLWLGTEADNQRDKAVKGRAIPGLKLHPELAARGERHKSRTHPESVPRGDQHPARLHPERMARGNENGAYTHPERRPHGEQHGNATINEHIVREIRTRYAAGGVSQTKLAAEYGINQTTVSRIILRQAWAHVT